MSSILDALEKLEATGGPQPAGGGGPPGRRPRRSWLVALSFLVAIAVGAGGAALFLRPGPPTDETDVASRPVELAQAATPVTLPAPLPSSTIPQPAATTSTTLEPSQPPLAAVSGTATPEPALGAGPRAAAPVPAPKPSEAERPWAWGVEPVEPPESAALLAVARATPPAAVPAPREVPSAPASDPGIVRAPVEAPPPAATTPPPGAPRLRVSFLVYSSVAERRTVALTIDGGGLTTLREGDEAQGVQVVRIRPDRVDLRWQGETFTLEVRS